MNWTSSILALVFLISPSMSLADDWYWGYGILSSDFSDFTIEDAEASSLTFDKRDQEPNGYTIFIGKPISPNVSLELAYEHFGKQKTSARFSTATIDSTAEAFGITPSIVIKPNEIFVDTNPTK